MSGFGSGTNRTAGRSAIVIATLFLGTTLARADAIDGSWCSENGRHIAIDGPSVTTPKGVRMQGNYTRHSFAFVMPPAETDAGAPVDMLLQGETRVRVTIGSASPEIWRRCPVPIS